MRGVEVSREVDLDLDDELALLNSASSGDGHSLAVDCPQERWVDDCAGRWFHEELSAVEVVDWDLHACECLGERDGSVNHEVRSFALEDWVRLLVEDDDDVTREPHTGDLVALTGEGDVVALLRALIDVHLEDLLVLKDLLAVAPLAAILGLAGDSAAVAARALDLHLLHKHRSELTGDVLRAGSVAVSACCVDAWLVGATAVALAAEAVTGDSELCNLSCVERLEWDGELVDDVLWLRLTALSAATAKEVGEDVRGVHSLHFVVDALLSVGIVALALLRVGQDFVSH